MIRNDHTEFNIRKNKTQNGQTKCGMTCKSNSHKVKPEDGKG